MSYLTEDVRDLNEHEIESWIHNRTTIVTLLFGELKIAPNYVFSNTGNSILHLSVKQNSIKLTKALITLGCNVNIQNRLGNTALIEAVLQENPMHVRILLEANSNIRLTNAKGDTALKLALKSIDSPFKIMIMEYLLQQVKSTATNSKEIAKILIEVDCSLACAVYLREIDVIQLMLDQGCDVNCHNFYNGWTPLHAAVMTGNHEMVRFLVQRGCDVNVTDSCAHLPIIHAIHNRKMQCPKAIKSLMPTDVNWTECHFAGWMKLRIVFVEGDKETLQLFLQSYDINLKAKDKKDMTPLHYLAFNANDGIFDLFQNCDFDIDACDAAFSKTALHIAANRGNVAAVKFLLDKGANVHAACFLGRPPLYYALGHETGRNNEYKKCIELLVQYGADLQVVTDKGETFFGVVSHYQNYFLAEPMLAHLAIVEVAGKPIKKTILDQIDANVHLKRRYDSFKQELAKMKTQTVYGTVTLLKFLTDNENKVALYTRRQESFNNSISTHFDSDSYYMSLLRKKFDKAMIIDALRSKAALVLNEMIQLERNHIIINHIISFLTYRDLSQFD